MARKLIVLIGLVLVGCGGTETKTVTETTVQTTTVEPTAKEMAQARRDLRNARSDLQDRRAELREIERRLRGARREVKRSTIPGTGTFLVGPDVDPGTYRAAARSGCYWARLASLDTSDIIDNANADGPVVVELLSSDKAFETNGCATFRKIS